MSEHPDWNILTLVTPKDNERTIKFYTERFGFKIVGEEDDAAVTMFWLRLSRKE
jgi:ribosomal protein S18 acetylase RimI-like enzyme